MKCGLRWGSYSNYVFYDGIPNSAGGVSVYINTINDDNKTIKYIRFTVTPYNAVGDVTHSSIGFKSTTTLRVVGPIKPGESSGWSLWENVWYDANVSTVVLSSAEVEYMDGAKTTFQFNMRRERTYTNPYDTSGCYVATAVYGSYDCPQVWTLRRYRDYTLAETWYGRAFIHAYYAISPTLVKWFGHTDWFKKMWKGKLDRMVASLNAQGVEDTPYEDRNW